MAETLDIAYFVALVGVLIFVHELGHFAWAKFFGVKVLTFSLGFGPKLFGFRRKETDYVVAAFPLGGYVKMLGESPHDVVSKEDEGRAFHQQGDVEASGHRVRGPGDESCVPHLVVLRRASRR